MAWSTVTIGMVSSKPEDCGVSFLSRSSYKVSVCGIGTKEKRVRCLTDRRNERTFARIYTVKNNVAELAESGCM